MKQLFQGKLLRGHQGCCTPDHGDLYPSGYFSESAHHAVSSSSLRMSHGTLRVYDVLHRY